MTDEPLSIPEIAPVFPLPDVVLFPRQVLPLHVFEPRYRTMTADALAGDRCIAIALLKPGFESQYFTRLAPIHSVIGVGRIVAHEELEDGKYNILVRGDARATILEETGSRPYRLARLESLGSYCAAPRDEVCTLRRTLRETIAAAGWAPCELRERFAELFDATLPLGDLTDLVAGCLPIDGELRQRMLSEANAYSRAQELLGHLRTLSAVAKANQLCGAAREMNFN